MVRAVRRTTAAAAAVVRADERGASLVELAFILPLAMLLIAGMLDFGYQFNARKAVSSATKFGSRIGAGHSRFSSFGIPCGGTITASCAGAPIELRLTDSTPVTSAAAEASCNYLRETRNIEPEHWQVQAQIKTYDEPSGAVSVETFQAVEVTLTRVGGCVVCFGGFFDSFVGGATARFVLEGQCS